MMGQEHLRNIAMLKGIDVSVIFDPDESMRSISNTLVPNAKFVPQYRGRNWNGEIHLFDMRSKQIYVGLLDKIVSFCENYGYTCLLYTSPSPRD